MNSAKAVVSAVVAALTVLVVQGGDVLPTWALLVLAAVVAGLSTWAVPNRPAGAHKGQAGAGELTSVAVTAAGVFIGGGVLWLLIKVAG